MSYSLSRDKRSDPIALRPSNLRPITIQAGDLPPKRSFGKCAERNDPQRCLHRTHARHTARRIRCDASAAPAYWKRHSLGEYSLQETAESYDWMARYTLEFVDWIFKHDLTAEMFLKNPPAKNGESHVSYGFPPCWEHRTPT